MTYGDVYVATIAMGANYNQCIKALHEAEAHDGPSLILAYSPCIDHNIKIGLGHMMEHEKKAVDSGYWPLYRYNPANKAVGKSNMELDSKKIRGDVIEWLKSEDRFDKLLRSNEVTGTELQAKLKDQSLDKQDGILRASLDDLDLLDMLKDELGEVSDGQKICILYASETGNTETLAYQLQMQFNRREIRTKVMDYNSFDIDDIPKQSFVVNLAATCGQGEFPGNSTAFWEDLNDPDLPPDFLDGVKMFTFGMGDSHYVFFNEVAVRIHERMKELGATEVMEIGMGDDQDEDKWETEYNEWMPSLFSEDMGDVEPSQELMDPTWNILKPNQTVTEPQTEVVIPPGSKIVSLNKAVNITPESDRTNWHCEFDLSGQGMSYAAGDALGVYPHNDETQVREFCAQIGRDFDELIMIEDVTGTRKNYPDSSIPSVTTVGQLFTQVLDVFGWPKRNFYEAMSLAATDEGEKAALAHLISKEGKGDLGNYVAETTTYAQLLQQFPSAELSLGHLVDFI